MQHAHTRAQRLGVARATCSLGKENSGRMSKRGGTGEVQAVTAGVTHLAEEVGKRKVRGRDCPSLPP